MTRTAVLFLLAALSGSIAEADPVAQPMGDGIPASSGSPDPDVRGKAGVVSLAMPNAAPTALPPRADGATSLQAEAEPAAQAAPKPRRQWKDLPRHSKALPVSLEAIPAPAAGAAPKVAGIIYGQPR